MILFRLIQSAMLHIFSSRRLLVWNLLACLITSCSTQMRNGVKDYYKDNCLENSTQNLETRKLNTEVDKQYTEEQLIMAVSQGDKQAVQRELSRNSNLAVTSPSAAATGIHALRLITCMIDFLYFSKNNKSRLQTFTEILGMLLDYCNKKHVEITSGLFENGKNIFHILIENIDLEKFNLVYKSKNPHVKKLRYLKNEHAVTPLYCAIKKYGETNLDSETQHKLETTIKKLWDQPSRICSNESKTGNNELHLTVQLHSNNTLPKNQKTFLEQVATKLRSVYSDLGRIKNLVNGVNMNNETPLHIAIRKVNLAMFKILCDWTGCTIKDINCLTPLCLAIEVYLKNNLDSTTQYKLEEMINKLLDLSKAQIVTYTAKEVDQLVEQWNLSYPKLDQAKKNFLGPVIESLRFSSDNDNKMIKFSTQN